MRRMGKVRNPKSESRRKAETRNPSSCVAIVHLSAALGRSVFRGLRQGDAAGLGLVNQLERLGDRAELRGGRGRGELALVALAQELAERGGELGADLGVGGDRAAKLGGGQFAGRQIEGCGHVMAQDLGDPAQQGAVFRLLAQGLQCLAGLDLRRHDHCRLGPGQEPDRSANHRQQAGRRG